MHIVIIIILLCIMSRLGTIARAHRGYRERQSVTWGHVGIALVSLPFVIVLWCLIAPHLMQILTVAGIALWML